MHSPEYASIFAEHLFDGQVSLVTGGGTGIGRAIAHELASLGSTVVIAGRREDKLADTVAEIRDAGGSADHVAADVRKLDEAQEMVDQTIARHGRLDHLVNNAGGQFPSPAADMSPNGWRTVIDLNLNATFLVSQMAYKAWMQDNGGAIVSVIADMWNGFPFMAHTGAARAGVDNLTKSLAVEWGPQGVRINAVAPGTIYSSGMDTYDPAFQKMIAEGAARIPVGRVGTESETSAAVVFLLTPAAGFITGATLRVDGGGSLAKQPMVPLQAHRNVDTFDGFHLAREIPADWLPDEGDGA